MRLLNAAMEQNFKDGHESSVYTPIPSFPRRGVRGADGVVSNDAEPPYGHREASDFQSGALRDSFVTTPPAPKQGGFATFYLMVAVTPP